MYSDPDSIVNFLNYSWSLEAEFHHPHSEPSLLLNLWSSVALPLFPQCLKVRLYNSQQYQWAFIAFVLPFPAAGAALWCAPTEVLLTTIITCHPCNWVIPFELHSSIHRPTLIATLRIPLYCHLGNKLDPQILPFGRGFLRPAASLRRSWPTHTERVSSNRPQPPPSRSQLPQFSR